MRRRKELDQERNSAAGDRRMAVEPEKLLHADCDLRAAVRLIIDRHARPGGRFEMRRRFGVEPSAQREGQTCSERGGELVGGKLGQ